MRLVIFIGVFLLSTLAFAQNQKPRIIGQKELSTPQGKSITITLTDLIVEETAADNDNGGNNNGGSDDGENTGEDDDDDNEPGGENSEGDNDDDDSGGDPDDSGDGGEDSDAGDKDDDDADDGDPGKGDDDGDKGKKDDDDRGDGEDKGGKDDDEKKGDKDNKDGKAGDHKSGGSKGKGKGKNGTRTLVYPQGYTLEIFDGKNYSFNGSTVVPDPAFSGTLTVAIRVTNGTHSSPKYGLKINVIAVVAPENKPPVINGQAVLTTLVDTPITVEFSDLLVSDADDNYPEGFSLSLQPGENYSVEGRRVNPSRGFTGELTVPVTVSDGKNSSAVFGLKITVKAAPPPNIAPQIAGQLPLSISMNQAVKIMLSHLMIRDPDSKYPDDFTLKIFPGQSYTLEGVTVRPHAGFTGDLTVNVVVHDGVNNSNVFPLKISVSNLANNKPVITAQVGLKIRQGQSLELKLAHLVVEDPDNVYPDDFTLSVASGANYTLAHNTLNPAANFLGTLTVPVTVHDGKVSSDPFPLKIEVIRGDKLEITGQKALEIPEDSSIHLELTHLQVQDPSNTFPQGFTLRVLPGNNYDVNNNRIRPSRDFSGNLTVPVTIRKGDVSSPAFPLLIAVSPVNDPPELLSTISEAIAINGPGPWSLFPDSEVRDADDDHLLFAEIGFMSGSFTPGIDYLQHADDDKIHAVFDEATGVLFMVGRAALEDYQKMIRSVSYTFKGPTDSISSHSRTIYIKLNDGKNSSADYERALIFNTNASLEIPSAFTPNSDNANDTWKITPSLREEQLKAFVRVFDKRGNVVFESTTLDHEWDGHYNGSPLPADVYFYTIEMDMSHRKVSYKGIVAILR